VAELVWAIAGPAPSNMAKLGMTTHEKMMIPHAFRFDITSSPQCRITLPKEAGEASAGKLQLSAPPPPASLEIHQLKEPVLPLVTKATANSNCELAASTYLVLLSLHDPSVR
jgi:hypothetical protein